MTLYARSDVMSVSIGGVDHTHRRPMREDKTPVRRWALECAECESALDDDVLWSKNKHNIPLTSEEEEETKRLNEEANAAIERERIAAARALAEGVNVQQRQQADDPDDKPATSDRVGEGGEQTSDGGKDEGESSQTEPVDYTKMSYPELQKAAKERGLDATGKKDALQQRLAEYDDQPVQ